VPDQELRTTNSTGLTYYEGSTRVSGKAGGRNATGKGYVEMTGYGE
jgi:predicted secreted hydrolase